MTYKCSLHSNFKLSGQFTQPLAYLFAVKDVALHGTGHQGISTHSNESAKVTSLAKMLCKQRNSLQLPAIYIRILHRQGSQAQAASLDRSRGCCSDAQRQRLFFWQDSSNTTQLLHIILLLPICLRPPWVLMRLMPQSGVVCLMCCHGRVVLASSGLCELAVFF